MADVVNRLQDLAEEVSLVTDPLLGHATLTVTRIEGGEADNVVPERCTIGIDRRLVPGEEVDRVIRQTGEAAATSCRHRAGIQVQTEAVHGMGSPSTPPGHPLVAHLLRCRDVVVGSHSEPAGFPACCDMVYLSQQGIPAVIFGPGKLSQAHAVDEHVSLGRVLQAAEIYGLLAVDWLDRTDG
jgi:acetylornithine deacetylase/succinyl-diaminopimelate desuccinylase-like protein